jgi:hypothetical protein
VDKKVLRNNKSFLKDKNAMPFDNKKRTEKEKKTTIDLNYVLFFYLLIVDAL